MSSTGWEPTAASISPKSHDPREVGIFGEGENPWKPQSAQRLSMDRTGFVPFSRTPGFLRVLCDSVAFLVRNLATVSGSPVPFFSKEKVVK